MISFALALLFAVPVALASTATITSRFSDSSPLSTTDLATCAAAAMKSDQGIDLYKRWADALDARYRKIHPRLSATEREHYTAERIVDKREALNRDGIKTVPAFRRFYDVNCSHAVP